MKNSVSETPPVLLRDRARALRAAQTEVERRLWQRLRNRQRHGAKFRRQHPIGPYIADFFCLDAGLVIELDGSQHGEEPAQRVDQRRTEYLANQGYHVLRFWNEEVLDNIDGVLEEIAKFL
jgi:very-short-patch-repair endonuclease